MRGTVGGKNTIETRKFIITGYVDWLEGYQREEQGGEWRHFKMKFDHTERQRLVFNHTQFRGLEGTMRCFNHKCKKAFSLQKRLMADGSERNQPRCGPCRNYSR